MRRVLVVIVMMIVSVNLLFGQTEENTDMKFAITQSSLGEINEADGARSMVYPFTNVSKTPIVINRVSVSCGCTTVSYSKVPIMPGHSSEIKVTYDPEFRPGFFDKKIYVYTAGRKKCNVLSLRGNVIARPKSIEDIYPYSIGSGLLSSSSAVDFGQIPVGYSHSLSLDIYNNSAKEMRVELPRIPTGGDYSYYITTPKLAAKTRGQVIVTFDLKESVKYAIYKFTIPIFVDGKREVGGDIKVSSISVPDASKAKFTGNGVPSIFLPDVYHNFSSLFLGESIIKTFEIENEGNRDLEIIQVILSDDDIFEYALSSKVIKPQTKADFIVKLTPKTRLGRVNSQIILITNDPAYPVSEIRIAANITENKE